MIPLRERDSEAVSHDRAEFEPKVVIVIPTWNRCDDVVLCIESLHQSSYRNVLVVIVDNASRDDTVAVLGQRFSGLNIIRNVTNRGYAGGSNVGIQWALDNGADYILILNNDTKVTPNLIPELVRIAESDPLIGVVGCRNLLMEEQDRLWGAYGVLTYGPFVVRVKGRNTLDGPNWRVVRDVDWVIGNGWLLRRAAVERIGFLDDDFFAYNEDVDWCVRARRAGYRIVYAGTTAILHKGGKSLDRTRGQGRLVFYLVGRSSILFIRKHARGREKACFAFWCSTALAGRLILALLASVLGSSRNKNAVRWASVSDFSRGLLDGLYKRPIPFARLGLDVGLGAPESGREVSRGL